MGQGSIIEILTVIDDGFAIPLAVLGRSILDHLGENRKVRITVFDGGLSEVSLRCLRESWDERIEARFIKDATPRLAGLRTTGRIPPVTFVRLLVSSLMSPDCDRVLILDADQLLLTDIGRLFDTPFDGATALSPRDAFIPTLGSPMGLSEPERWGLAPSDPFLSGAVVLLDLHAWRQMKGEEKALEIVDREYARLQTFDQDVLNIVLAGKWRLLDDRYQVQPRTGTLRGLRAADRDPWIVHFSGRLKPWLYRGPSQWDRRFLETLSRTAFRDRAPGWSLRGLLYSLYDSPLRRLFYPIEWRLGENARRVTKSPPDQEP